VQSLKLTKYKEGKIILPITTETIEISYYLDYKIQSTDISNFTVLKSVSLTHFRGDLSPLISVELVTLHKFEGSSLDGLGRNKMVKIIDSGSLRIVSALKTIPRVIIQSCENICNWTDLRHVQYLTISQVTPNFTFFDSADEKCSIRKLELSNCYGLKSLIGLGNIPVLIVKSCLHIGSLEGLGNNQIIILEGNRSLTSVELDNYSTQFFPSTSSYGSGQYMLQRK
jgi:hypothetical protein